MRTIPCTALACVALLLPACERGGTPASRDPAAFPVDSGFVTTDDGVGLFYRTIGEGSLAVVIPVALYLEDALAPLAAAERRLVFYDPRGRGRSESGDRSRVTLDRQLADLDQVRAHFALDSMVLIGWSGLGMETAVYAMRQPDRVIRLIQVAPVAARDAPHNAAAYAERSSRLDTAAVRGVQARHAAGGFADEPAEYCRALAVLTRPASFADTTGMSQVPDVCAFPNEHPDSLSPLFQALLGSFAGYDWREELRTLSVPRLVIHGVADAFPLAGSREWVPPGPAARLLVVDRAGHFPFLERADIFFPAVEAFLRGEWPAGAERG